MRGWATGAASTDSDGDGARDGVEIIDVNRNGVAGFTDALIVAKAASLLAPFNPGPLTPAETRAYDVNRDGFVSFSDPLTVTTFAAGVPPCAAGPGRFGVTGAVAPGVEGIVLSDLHAGRVRVNNHLDGSAPDFSAFPAAGLDVVITLNNAHVANAQGYDPQYPRAGYPFISEAVYRADIDAALAPSSPTSRSGARSGFRPKTRSRTSPITRIRRTGGAPATST